MNWYEGNIAEAVAQSKAKNAIFVVYIEGKDESTQKLTKFINEQRIRSKLESEDFVAIKIESDSQAYMQFATIYQVVPVPSIFFIGKSGTPLEIGTGVIDSADELEQKIEKVLAASGKSSASSSFINAEKSAESVAQPSTSAQVADKSATQTEEVVCDGDICYKKTVSSEVPSDPKKDEEKETTTTTTTAELPAPADDAGARLEETRKMLEQKRRERVEAEKQLEKDHELRRRADGKQTQNVQQWQKEQELKDLKENLRRDRMEEQAVRDRIRAQIAADRAERAQKFAEPAASAASAAKPTSPKPNAGSDTARLQFRFSNGDSATHNFNCQETLATVRAYVKEELLTNTGIKTFGLSTNYPKRELTTELDAQTLTALGLFPSAVILVMAKEGNSGPSAMIARSGGLLNMLTTLFWAMMSPVFKVFGYFKNMGGGGGETAAATGAAKRANEEHGAQHDAAKRRNLERFSAGGGNSVGSAAPSTSRAAADDSAEDGGEQKPYRRLGGSNIHRLSDNRKDSDDENATWNGNSTQQQ